MSVYIIWKALRLGWIVGEGVMAWGIEWHCVRFLCDVEKRKMGNPHDPSCGPWPGPSSWSWLGIPGRCGITSLWAPFSFTRWWCTFCRCTRISPLHLQGSVEVVSAMTYLAVPLWGFIGFVSPSSLIAFPQHLLLLFNYLFSSLASVFHRDRQS
jgi:hypothetical protein